MSQESLNILAVGKTQSNFLINLYDGLKKGNPAVKVYIEELEHLGDTHIKSTALLLKNIQIKKLSGFQKWGNYISFLSNKRLWQLLSLEVKNRGLRYATRSLKPYYTLFLKAKAYDDLEVDCIHCHFASLAHLKKIVFIRRTPVIVSFWGSDLLRQKDPHIDAFKKVCLQNTTALTIQNETLKRELEKRFNTAVKNKIHVVKFLQNAFYITSFKEIGLKRTPINDKVNIMVGHNGYKENNHIPILDQLRNIEDPERFCIHLFLTYGLDTGYEKELFAYLSEYPIQYELYKTYSVGEDLVALRSRMDVLIYAPVSDAMSGTVTEALYSGCKVIAGKWLPYEVYHKTDAPMYFFENFDELPDLIPQVVKDTPKDIKDIHVSLDAVFGDKVNVKKWLELFNTVYA